jgi:hypothetical protein
MASLPLELKEKAEQVKAGKKTSAKVRTLLDWFGAQRRRQGVVAMIRESLVGAGLRTEPDFEHAYIDERVVFLPAGPPGSAKSPLPVSVEQVVELAEPPTAAPAPTDPTYRIGKLPSANTPPIAVTPNDTVKHAVTLMLKHDFSQLPVMTGTRDVKGIVSWKSLGSRLALGRKPERLLDFVDSHHELSSDVSLFEAIPAIIECDCVLIRDRTQAVCGIVTAADLSVQFRQLTEPFLLLNEVEDHVRNLVNGRFSATELAAARDPSASARPVSRVADLTLGEYLRLLEKPDNWARLDLQVSRRIFTDSLRGVLDIRNDVMHFDPDGIEEKQLTDLRNFVAFLQRLQAIRRE